MGSLLGIGTGLRTGLALGRTSNIPPTATPPLGGPPSQKANEVYEAMGVHTSTVVTPGSWIPAGELSDWVDRAWSLLTSGIAELGMTPGPFFLLGLVI